MVFHCLYDLKRKNIPDRNVPTITAGIKIHRILNTIKARKLPKIIINPKNIKISRINAPTNRIKVLITKDSKKLFMSLLLPCSSSLFQGENSVFKSKETEKKFQRNHNKFLERFAASSIPLL
jgi:hypothetical protein